MTSATLERPVNQLASSYLKKERADYHIDDLEMQARDFFSAKENYRFVSKRDPESGKQIVYLKINKPLPESWPCIIGDACSNLISALDHLYVALQRRHRDGSSGGYYPIKKDSASFNTLIENGNIRGEVGSDAERLIACTQPFKVTNPSDGGNSALWLPKKLRNDDIHNLLIPAWAGGGPISGIAGGNVVFFGVIPFGARLDQYVPLGETEKLGVNVLADGRVDPEPDITYAGDIKFGSIHGLDSQSVIPALKAFSEEISRVLTRFSGIF